MCRNHASSPQSLSATDLLLTINPDFEPVLEETPRQPNLIDFNDYESYSSRAYADMVRSTLASNLHDQSLVNDLVNNLERGHQALLSDFRTQHTSEPVGTVSESNTPPKSQSTTESSVGALFDSSLTSYETYPRGYSSFEAPGFDFDCDFTSYGISDQAQIPAEGFSAETETTPWKP